MNGNGNGNDPPAPRSWEEAFKRAVPLLQSAEAELRGAREERETYTASLEGIHTRLSRIDTKLETWEPKRRALPPGHHLGLPTVHPTKSGQWSVPPETWDRIGEQISALRDEVEELGKAREEERLARQVERARAEGAETALAKVEAAAEKSRGLYFKVMAVVIPSVAIVGAFVAWALEHVRL